MRSVRNLAGWGLSELHSPFLPPVVGKRLNSPTVSGGLWYRAQQPS